MSAKRLGMPKEDGLFTRTGHHWPWPVPPRRRSFESFLWSFSSPFLIAPKTTPRTRTRYYLHVTPWNANADMFIACWYVLVLIYVTLVTASRIEVQEGWGQARWNLRQPWGCWQTVPPATKLCTQELSIFMMGDGSCCPPLIRVTELAQ